MEFYRYDPIPGAVRNIRGWPQKGDRVTPEGLHRDGRLVGPAFENDGPPPSPRLLARGLKKVDPPRDAKRKVKADAKAAEAAIGELGEVNLSLQAEVQRLRAQVELQAGQLAERDADLAALREKLAEADAQITRLKAAQADRDALEATVVELRAELEALDEGEADPESWQGHADLQKVVNEHRRAADLEAFQGNGRKRAIQYVEALDDDERAALLAQLS